MSIVNFYTKEGTEPRLANCYGLPDCPICFEKCNPCYVQCPNGHTCCERHHVERIRAIYEGGGRAFGSNAQHCFECRTSIPDSSFSPKYFNLLKVTVLFTLKKGSKGEIYRYAEETGLLRSGKWAGEWAWGMGC